MAKINCHSGKGKNQKEWIIMTFPKARSGSWFALEFYAIDVRDFRWNARLMMFLKSTSSLGRSSRTTQFLTPFFRRIFAAKNLAPEKPRIKMWKSARLVFRMVITMALKSSAFVVMRYDSWHAIPTENWLTHILNEAILTKQRIRSLIITGSRGGERKRLWMLSLPLGYGYKRNSRAK